MNSRSDEYSISINSLVFTSNLRTAHEFQECLYDHGYYGRAEVSRIHTKNFQEVFVKAEVYLPDSCFTYTWPLFTHFDLASKSFGKRKKPRVLSNEFRLKKCLTFFSLNKIPLGNNIEAVAETAAKYFGWATKDDYVKMIHFLIRAGLFHNGNFLMKDIKDLNEVYSNLFDANYFNID